MLGTIGNLGNLNICSATQQPPGTKLPCVYDFETSYVSGVRFIKRLQFDADVILISGEPQSCKSGRAFRVGPC